jgi:hypothetical protein
MGRCILLLVVPIVLAAPAEAEEGDAEFRRKVDAAITKGCEYLAHVQAPDGTWKSPYDQKFPGGATALCLLALLQSEHNIWSDAVVKAMDYVLAQKFNRTYSAAIAMMAVEARNIPPEEFKARRESKKVKKRQRKLSKEHREFMQWHANMLLEGRQHDAWGYPKNPDGQGDWGGDLSNTQYALLGLKSAARCKIKIEEGDWLRILRIVLNAQERQGKRVRLIVDKKDDYLDTRWAETRGWRYRWPYTIGAGGQTQTVNPPPDDKPSGSMTTAGISCLAIIHSGLLRSRRYRDKLKDVAKAIDDGFSLVQENWSVETNPGGNGWHFYYLYGLERAGVLADRRWIGDHDWYREGADYLLERQYATGAWSNDILQTSFALLFLKRSTTPVALTGLHR